MRTFFDVMLLESNKACPGKGRGALSLRVAVSSLFLHRTSAVHVNLFIASTTYGFRWMESESLETQFYLGSGWRLAR